MYETLTTRHVAERLHVQPKTVRKWIKTGELKASNLGGKKRPRYVIREASVEAFLEARAVVGIEQDTEETGGA